MTKATHALGSHGERLAAAHLTAAGMAILDRNWRCRDGEIDLIARDGAVLAIVEVKTRRGVRYGTAAEAVTPAKVQRLRRLATAWLSATGIRAATVRIDVVAVQLSANGLTIEHLPGVG